MYLSCSLLFTLRAFESGEREYLWKNREVHLSFMLFRSLRSLSPRSSSIRSIATMKTPWVPSQSLYPAVRRDEAFVETFESAKSGSILVADPYHHLEDPAAPSTVEFVASQAAFAKKYLQQNQNLDKFKQRLTKSWNYERRSLPALKGDDQYYYTYNSGLSAQSKIYRFPKSDLLQQGDGELFFDVSPSLPVELYRMLTRS